MMDEFCPVLTELAENRTVERSGKQSTGPTSKSTLNLIDASFNRRASGSHLRLF